jgi:hypothetical protein
VSMYCALTRTPSIRSHVLTESAARRLLSGFGIIVVSRASEGSTDQATGPRGRSWGYPIPLTLAVIARVVPRGIGVS